MAIVDAIAALSVPDTRLAEAGFVRERSAQPFVKDGSSSGSDRLIAESIAEALRLAPNAVVVRTLDRATGPAKVTIVPVRATGARMDDPAASARYRALLRLHAVTFPAFAVSVRQTNGEWITLQPSEGPLTAWRVRVLTAFALSLLLTAPIGWWSARALTRPVRLFAQAAERIGIDSGATPLTPSGPAEIVTAARSINRMQDRLRHHIRDRIAMATAIAHDLRTPLTGLRLSVEALPAKQRDRMAADIRRMEAMIAQSLAFARRGNEVEPFERVDLAEIVGLCVADARERNHRVTLSGSDSLPVMGEPLALSRAIDNLIENAAIYAGQVDVEFGSHAGEALILVRDKGPGIAAQDLDRVFEPFYRLEPSRSRTTGGIGLGLATSRSIARAHGGDLKLRNRMGGGLEAELSIPHAEV
ncbi:HAMP domain-containing protein [Sphingomonas sp. R647]|uniref:sensor histidine kinase n=1 Tax=Sphingomonas sp. R647 TaxID=2875233 RepID=UPI001CD5D4F2|nr:ATP-binding protein [Sphingomonas sp. R647]MCA1196519.1 HAMP domain-containing protein [Sphingomonas sp. R647]